MAPRVAVIADSAASIPEALVRRWGIGVVPLQVIVDDVARDEGGPSDSPRVLEELESGAHVTTSQPSVGAFLDAYAAAAAAGAHRIVSIHISGDLSGTVDAARLAAKDASVPVDVIDTRTLAMASGFAVLAAAQAAERGDEAEAVAQVATDVAASSRCYFTVATLEFLRRGGRVSGPLAAIGGALSLRPVLEMRDGKVELLERVRTTARARDRVTALAEERLAELERPGLAIMALGAQEYADDVAGVLESRHVSIEKVVRTPVSAVLAAHTGPGTLAAAIAELPAGFA